MLYYEFVEGTGCKDSEYNHKVYENLEVMYMNSDMTKEEVYEYGKKLVDNGKSEEQIAFENRLKEERKALRSEAKAYSERANFYDTEARLFKDKGDYDSWRAYRSWAESCREDARRLRSKIRELNFILG